MNSLQTILAKIKNAEYMTLTIDEFGETDNLTIIGKEEIQAMGRSVERLVEAADKICKTFRKDLISINHYIACDNLRDALEPFTGSGEWHHSRS